MKETVLRALAKRGYTVERCIDPEDERYRLMRGEDIIYDDSACEDFYGTQEEVAAIFWDMLCNESGNELRNQLAEKELNPITSYTCHYANN